MPTQEKMQEIANNIRLYLQEELDNRDSLEEIEKDEILNAINKIADLQDRAIKYNTEHDLSGDAVYFPSVERKDREAYNDAIDLLLDPEVFGNRPENIEEDLERRYKTEDPSFKRMVQMKEQISRAKDKLYSFKITTDFNDTEAVMSDRVGTALDRLYTLCLKPHHLEREREAAMEKMTDMGRTAARLARTFTDRIPELTEPQKQTLEPDLLTLADFADGKETSSEKVQQALSRIKDALPSHEAMQPTFLRNMKVTDAKSVSEFFTQVKDFVCTFAQNRDMFREYDAAKAEADRQAAEAQARAQAQAAMPDMTQKDRARYIASTLNGLVAFNHPDIDMVQAGKLANTFANLSAFGMNQPNAKADFVPQGVKALCEQYPELKAKYDTGELPAAERVTELLKDCFEIEKRNLNPENRKAMGEFNPFTAEKIPYVGKPAPKQAAKQAEKQAQPRQMGH